MTPEPLDVFVIACAGVLLAFVVVDFVFKQALRGVRFLRARRNVRREIRAAAARREPAHTVTRMARPAGVPGAAGDARFPFLRPASVVGADLRTRRPGQAVVDPDSCYATTSLRVPVLVKPAIVDYDGGDVG